MPPRPGLNRRQMLGATTAAAIGALALPASMANAAPTSPPRPRPNGTLTLRWLGNNSWELRSGDSRVLIDPWISRFVTGTYTKAGADPNTPLSVDTAAIDRFIKGADQILVTHGHYDHLPDVPYIASRTGATVLGTETHCNLLRALGAPVDQLSVMRGGERLLFGSTTIEVIPSLHSATGPRDKVAFPGTIPTTPPERPQVISDLLEGGTLAYQVNIGGLSVLNLGGSNYLPRELEGRRPDCLLVPPGGAAVPGYIPQLLDLLGHPPYILPTHWDEFDLPLDQPAKDAGGLQALREAVATASPSSRFVVLDHNATFTP